VDAKTYALWLLNRRSYPEVKLRFKLKERGFAEMAIASVLKNFKERGYINDLEYAKSFIRERCRLRPRAARVLALELRKRGISRGDIETALEDAETMGDEKELIRRLVGKKKKQYAKLDDRIARQRLLGYLARRGFSLSNIKEVLDESAKAETD